MEQSPAPEAEPLPSFTVDQFRLTDGPECDVIMKGGITSGIVYPYAILELATRYRFRSLGGTSAGAIAAAFAAAAEYSRSVRNDPSGFLRLKRHCDDLPERLLSLFQPDEELEPLAAVLAKAARSRSPAALVLPVVRPALAAGAIAALLAGLLTWLLSEQLLATVLAALLGGLLGALAGGYLSLRRTLLLPILNTIRQLPARMFGLCSGLTGTRSPSPAVTDWLHAALQDIAFGSPDAPEVLTFGHLETGSRGASIELRMVTTNLSMMRPHTLPKLGLRAGYDPDEWRKLFPDPVLAHLERVARPWKKLRLFPLAHELPVVVATRMSLSFPLLFKAVPLHAEDYEHFRVMRGLGGPPERVVRTMWMSDGGISSNFPIHMFDAPLPTRPTFAISLDALQVGSEAVTRRVLLPSDAMTGLGVPITPIDTVPAFLGQIFYSAKDWQDQLLGGITGQRERIARVYLTPREGGLNLDMPPDVSRALMGYGLEVGRLFTSGQFSFDEHRYRRLLAFYRNSTAWLDQAGAAWNGGFEQWYASYAPHVRSYKLSGRSRNALRVAVSVTLVPPPPEHRLGAGVVRHRFPRVVGRLRNVPEY